MRAVTITKADQHLKRNIRRRTYSTRGMKRHPLSEKALDCLERINANIRGSQRRQGYLAGIIDGEGSITSPRLRNSPSISVISTTPELMEWLKNNVGGSVYERTPYHTGLGKKRIYCWRICGWYIVPRLLSFLVDKMIVKRKVALRILDYDNGKS